jgi:hypothetical protein
MLSRQVYEKGAAVLKRQLSAGLALVFVSAEMIYASVRVREDAVRGSAEKG